LGLIRRFTGVSSLPSFLFHDLLKLDYFIFTQLHVIMFSVFSAPHMLRLYKEVIKTVMLIEFLLILNFEKLLSKRCRHLYSDPGFLFPPVRKIE